MAQSSSLSSLHEHSDNSLDSSIIIPETQTDNSEPMISISSTSSSSNPSPVFNRQRSPGPVVFGSPPSSTYTNITHEAFSHYDYSAPPPGMFFHSASSIKMLNHSLSSDNLNQWTYQSNTHSLIRSLSSPSIPTQLTTISPTPDPEYEKKMELINKNNTCCDICFTPWEEHAWQCPWPMAWEM